MSSSPPTMLTAEVTRTQSESLASHAWGWFLFVSSLFWPRVFLLGFWIFGQEWMSDAFDGRWVIPVAGFFLMPWTVVAWALMWGLTSDGVFGLEWLCIGVAVLLDLATLIEGRRLLRR
jgi:hypothetical protein